MRKESSISFYADKFRNYITTLEQHCETEKTYPKSSTERHVGMSPVEYRKH